MSNRPSGWKDAELSEFCEIIQGQSPPSDTYNRDATGLPFFQGKTDFGLVNPTARVWCTAPSKIAEAGDILISIRAPVGPTNIADEQCAIGRGIAAIRPLGGITTSFVTHAIRFRESQLQRVATGSTFSAVSGPQLRALSLPLPPLLEQRRIVAEIEKQFTRLDQTNVSIQNNKRRLVQLNSSVLEETFAEFRDDVCDLGEISDIQGGIQKQPKNRPVKNIRPFLRVANVLRGRLNLQDVHGIEVFGSEAERLRLEAGDLLIVEGNGSPGEIGRMAIWDGSIADCIHQNHIIRARLRPNVLPGFIEAYWNSPTGSRAVRSVASSTSGLHTLSVNKVKQIPCPVPTIERQETALTKIDRITSTIEATTRALEASSSRAARLRQAILAKAFSGQLVPQDPNDEPASILLDRIRAERNADALRGETSAPQKRRL